MLLHDVAIERLHVVLGVDRAGLVGEDGETHHGVFDVSYLDSVPGITVFAPASFAELERMLERAVLGMDGPVAVRYHFTFESEKTIRMILKNPGVNPFKDFTRGHFNRGVE